MTLMFLGFQWFQFTSLKGKLSRESKLTQHLLQQYDEASGKNDEAQKGTTFKRLAKQQADQSVMFQDACEETFWSSIVYGLFVILLSFYFLKMFAQQKTSCVANLAESPKP